MRTTWWSPPVLRRGSSYDTPGICLVWHSCNMAEQRKTPCFDNSRQPGLPGCPSHLVMLKFCSLEMHSSCTDYLSRVALLSVLPYCLFTVTVAFVRSGQINEWMNYVKMFTWKWVMQTNAHLEKNVKNVIFKYCACKRELSIGTEPSVFGLFSSRHSLMSSRHRIRQLPRCSLLSAPRRVLLTTVRRRCWQCHRHLSMCRQSSRRWWWRRLAKHLTHSVLCSVAPGTKWKQDPCCHKETRIVKTARFL